MIEINNRIPQISSITLEEKDDFYLLEIEYCPRYGFGVIDEGSGYDSKSYNFLLIGNLDLYENINNDIDSFMNSPKTEIKLFFPEKTYLRLHSRNKETEYILFTKKSFYEGQELFYKEYND